MRCQHRTQSSARVSLSRTPTYVRIDMPVPGMPGGGKRKFAHGACPYRAAAVSLFRNASLAFEIRTRGFVSSEASAEASSDRASSLASRGVPV